MVGFVKTLHLVEAGSILICASNGEAAGSMAAMGLLMLGPGETVLWSSRVTGWVTDKTLVSLLLERAGSDVSHFATPAEKLPVWPSTQSELQSFRKHGVRSWTNIHRLLL